VKKLVENLQQDLRTLSSESKRKFTPVKEAAEAGLLKIRQVSGQGEQDIIHGLVSSSSDILQPFVLGCDTKHAKIVHLCLTAIQRLISHEIVSVTAANNILQCLWVLMEAGLEELKLLQTAILLITTNSVVQHESLAKALVLCFRLYFTKDSTTINTAAATVRQLVSVVFERVIVEDGLPSQEPMEAVSIEVLKAGGRQAPRSLRPCAMDAYLLFQDFCQLVNADQPYWLIGMTEMTRTFGLELMESLLTSFPQVFLKHPEFSFLLKERVCPVVIKLFSPSLKYRAGAPAPPPSSSSSVMDKPYFPIVMRLLRIVSVLIKHYYTLLTTECEIFLSLLVKFLDNEKPMWQRACALEVLSKLCSQPHLIRSFCQSYDMKQHSTKIFQDIVNGLGAFIQSQFVSAPSSQNTQPGAKSSDVQGQSPSMVGGMPVGSGVTPQPAFFYRNIWIPILINVSATPVGGHRTIYLEVLDKVDAPGIPDGYGLSLAFMAMLDVVRSVQTLVEENLALEKAKTETTDKTEADSEPVDGSETASKPVVSQEGSLNCELINSSWCGVLAALTLLLDASSDESATEAILKCEQTYASLCGRLGLDTSRDAFMTGLCKASLPPHYTLTVLKEHSPASPAQRRSQSSLSSAQGQTAITQHHELIQGSQVVAVGTPLPTASLPLGAQQGPVMLTSKNIQCMRSLLTIAHCHGGILGNAWHMVLTTLQHLVWILGLKPSTGGSLRATQQASDSPNAVITTAVMADLPVLSSMLSRLFESSQYLDDVALHHLIDALCKLSTEAMELHGFSNREPSLFAVAKLLETGLVNLPRVSVLWKPVTAHLLEVCQHPHAAMRGWGAEAVTSLTKAVLAHQFTPPLHEQQKLQTMLLRPLEQLSDIHHPDIRHRQLDCVLAILHKNGEALGHAWPTLLHVIAAVTNDQGEVLIRTAFQCLQLVITDFLPVMPCPCLHYCLEAASRFGTQSQELNISLTAIGLLWNISDFFSQNQAKLTLALAAEPPGSADLTLSQNSTSTAASSSLPPFDGLWMALYSRLGDLCVDGRPAVRKSAGQTLFTTISAHGTLIQQTTWQLLLWQVLFPLLDRVKKLSSTASDCKEDANTGNILIHHSRDTAEKQWAETRVLTLAGVARVFNIKRRVLQQLGDFPRAWALLLEMIESGALCRNAEVSLAALRSFQEILHIQTDQKLLVAEFHLVPPASESISRDIDANSQQDSESDEGGGEETEHLDSTLWATAWKVWLSIGTLSTVPPTTATSSTMYVPSQAFLTALVQIFPALYEHIKARFVSGDLSKLSVVLQRALAVPVHGDHSPFIMPVGEVGLTSLQEAILSAIEVLCKEAIIGSENLPTMYPELFSHILVFVEYSVRPPKFGKVDTKSVNSVTKAGQADWVAMNYVPFAEAVVEQVVTLYRATANHPAVRDQAVTQAIVKCLRLPLGLKYGCASQSTWMLAINSLLSILYTAIPIARKHETVFAGMWLELGGALDDFLFSQHAPPPTLSVEDFQIDEAVDCKVVELIRDDILPHAKSIPSDFVIKVMNILNKGSIHSATSAEFIDTDSSRKLREEFAKSCFETLLKFSFISHQDSGADSGPEAGSITHLAVTSLLHRCQDVLTKYVADERLSGRCPLPRPRMSEMSFVLKAVSTLLVTLKKAPRNNVEPDIWWQVIGLYPALVECTTSTSPQVCRALKDALQEYTELLAPPTVQTNGGKVMTNGVS